MGNTTGARIVVVGSNDRLLDETLRTAGASVSMQAMEALAALAHPSASPPDAMVIDLRDQDALPASLPLFKRHHPAVGVVIIAQRFEPALMLEAMRAGVTEWLAEPLSPTALVDAVERVARRHAVKAATGQVFAFVGAKGGVGATTTAVNIATALKNSTAARKALLIDLHMTHGDAALFLNAEPKFSIADAVENIHRLDEAFFKGVVTHTKAGPDLLASSDRQTIAAVNVDHIKNLIDVAAQHYPFVCLDVPRTDVVMLDALELSADILVVANQELATVRRAGPLVLALRQRYGRERVSVVITRYDKSAEIQREDVERVIGTAVRHVIPSDYRLALTSLNKGLPLVVENHNKLAASFVGLANQLAGHDKPQAAPPKSSGLFSRFGVR